MTLDSILQDVSPESLEFMAAQLGQRSETLAEAFGDAAKAWSRLYGFLSVEMDCAALRQRTGISL